MFSIHINPPFSNPYTYLLLLMYLKKKKTKPSELFPLRKKTNCTPHVLTQKIVKNKLFNNNQTTTQSKTSTPFVFFSTKKIVKNYKQLLNVNPILTFSLNTTTSLTTILLQTRNHFLSQQPDPNNPHI